jgi:hypothetical protein
MAEVPAVAGAERAEVRVANGGAQILFAVCLVSLAKKREEQIASFTPLSMVPLVCSLMAWVSS